MLLEEEKVFLLVGFQMKKATRGLCRARSDRVSLQEWTESTPPATEVTKSFGILLGPRGGEIAGNLVGCCVTIPSD